MAGLNGLQPTLKLFLRVVFRLKYLEGLGEKMLSEWLDVPPFIVEKYVKKLDEYLKAKLGEVSPETLRNICPECLETRVCHDPESGERVCANCGLVVEMESYDLHLPFETTYALTSELAYGRSLGGTLGYQGLVRVLAKSPSTPELINRQGNAHLGTRARLARIITETVEPPPVRLALRKARDLAFKYELQADFAFNNYVGVLIKRAFFLNQCLADSTALKQRLPETCFWLALRRFGKANLAHRFLEENNVNHALAIALEELQAFLEDVKRRARIRGKVLQTFPALAVVEE